MLTYLYRGEKLTREQLGRKAARRQLGTCQDCGHHKPVRTVTFWATGMPYRVCEPCERVYGPKGMNILNWPVLRREV
jgi:hypothetical protein